MAGKKRIRRDRRTIIEQSIEKVEDKIAKAEEKLNSLKEEKAILEDQLFAIDNEEAMKAKEEEHKKIIAFLEKHNITSEQLESLVSKTE